VGVVSPNIATLCCDDFLIDGTAKDWWRSFLLVILKPFHLSSLCPLFSVARNSTADRVLPVMLR
jgi:hypothetical protein